MVIYEIDYIFISIDGVGFFLVFLSTVAALYRPILGHRFHAFVFLSILEYL
jgi:hypothetical protein